MPNSFYEVELQQNQNTEMFFENLLSPPAAGAACLDFRYKKFSKGEPVNLNVLAWPFRGKPGKISIARDSPDRATWIRAQVTYRNIDNYFLVMFRSHGPATASGRLYLAIDDVTITAGKCDG